MQADVLIVEDEPAIVDLLALNLRHAGMTVRIALDATQARHAIKGDLPDVVILDWMLPGESGVQLVRQWRCDERTRLLPVIMLTARTDEQDRVSGLDSGADDYLAKPFSTRELLARVRAVLRRRMPEALGEPVRLRGIDIDPANRRVTCHGKAADLSPTEFKLLHFLMVHPDRIHSRAHLLDRVWGDHVFIEERTVDVHVKRLRQGLRLANADECIETVRGAGYRFNTHQAKPTTLQVANAVKPSAAGGAG